MKTLLSILAAASITIIPSSAIGGQAGTPGTGAANDEAALCKALVGYGEYDSVGECVSHYRNHFLELCQDIKDVGGYPTFLGNGTVVTNQGDCVSYFRHYGT